MFFGLRSYQLEGANFLINHPRAGLFFDCGLGKTLTTLAAISHLREQFLPVLVVAPLRVARHVWPDEIEKWGFDLTYKMVHGKNKVGQLRDRPTDLTMINPEGLGSVVEFCESIGQTPWRSVVVDESTFFKNPAAKRWQIMSGICNQMERVIGLTASPISGRGHIDLWGQVELLSPWQYNPLGSYQQFTDRWFTFDVFNRPRIKPGADDEINRLVSPLYLRKDVNEIPMPILIEKDEVVDITPGSRRRYDEMRIEENSYNPLRTIASGFEYDRHWSGEVNPLWMHDKKIEALAEIIDACPGEQILVFANFVAEIELIARKFGAKTSKDQRVIAEWNAKRVPLLVVNPRSFGHGVNLQMGGHRVVWFDLPDAGDLYDQGNGRLWRSGQNSSTVFVHRLLAADTIDITIAKLLAKKALNEDNLLAAVAFNRYGLL